MTRLIVLAVVALTAPGWLSEAAACSCVPGSGAFTCGLPQRQVVFAGVVRERVERLDVAGRDDRDRIRYAYRFAVTETFAGAERQEVLVPNSGSSCDVDFKVGDAYLVYGWPTANGMVAVNACGRILQLGDARDEIVLLRQLRTGQLVSRVFGTVRVRPPQESYARLAVEGVVVTVRDGTASVATTTDAQGRFVFEALRPGSYSIAVGWPSRYQHGDSPRNVTVGACGAADVDFRADAKPTLMGLVVEEGVGRAPPGLRVTAIPIDGSPIREAYSVVDEHGSYTFSALPPGRYVLGVNIGQPPTLRHPFPPRYHASANARDAAIPVDLREAGVRLDLTTGPRIKQRAIGGTVVNGLGRPVPSAFLYVTDADSPPVASVENTVRADAAGRFRVIALDGRRYTLTSFTAGPPGPPGLTLTVTSDIADLIVVQSATHPSVVLRDLLSIGVDWIRSLVGWR